MKIPFFDIGGDSISAAELAATCSRAGLDLTLQDVIDFPTVAQQTLYVGGQGDRLRDPGGMRQGWCFPRITSSIEWGGVLGGDCLAR